MSEGAGEDPRTILQFTDLLLNGKPDPRQSDQKPLTCEQGRVTAYDTTTKIVTVRMGDLNDPNEQTFPLRHLSAFTPAVGNDVIVVKKGRVWWVWDRLA